MSQHHIMFRHFLRILPFCCAALLIAADEKSLFEGNTDVGDTPKKGAFQYDPATGEYRVTGGGANIWASTDAFQFAWKNISGDVTITADVRFIGTGAVAHRKAALMIRQNLEPGSAYADVAVHGDGLTSLQFRPTGNAITQEIRSESKGPVRIRIERRGDPFTMFAGNQTAQRPRYGSKISVFDLASKSTRVVYDSQESFEAPNWSIDRNFLLANSAGRLFRIPVDGAGPATPEPLKLDPSFRCNNDHGISPNGKLIAFSASSPNSRQSQVTSPTPTARTRA